jgi:glycerophosphoryl diester phosphodiesterase
VQEESPGKVYNYLDIKKKGVEGHYVDNLKISFKVEKKWLVEHQDETEQMVLHRYMPSEGDWAELETADAGARTVIDGVDYAGQRIAIPRLVEALDAFPNARWVLEIKNDTPEAAQAMCDVIRRAGAQTRALVGSFHDDAMSHFRQACPEVATSASSGEVQKFVIAARLGLSRWVDTPAVAFQLPMSGGGIDLTHPRIIDAAQARGIKVQYWTINAPADMERLLSLGADGLITDYVDRSNAAREAVCGVSETAPGAVVASR